VRAEGRAAAALAWLALASCARTPTGDYDLALVQQSDVEQEAREVSAAIPQEWIVSDAALNDYVRAVGARVVASSAEPERAYQFRILDVAEPAAFSLADGSIFVTRGLLVMLNSEAELAFVFGHEIAHVTGRHHRSQASRQAVFRGLSLLTTPLDPGGGLRNALPMLADMGFSRADERAADDLGLDSAAAAGFSGACGIRVLFSFEILRRAAGEEGSGLFASHPEPMERLQRLEESRELDPSPDCPSDYVEHVLGTPVGIGGNGIYVDGPRSVVFTEHAFRVRFDASDGQMHVAASREGAVVAAPERGALVEVKRLPAVRDFADARREALGWKFGDGRHDARKLAYDELDVGGRPSLRLRMERTTREGGQIEQYQWIADAGRVYRLEANVPEDAWQTAGPFLERFAAGFDGLTAEELAVQPIQPRLRLHETSVGETLASISQHYGVWSPLELALYNGYTAGGSLAAGTTLKVARREPLGSSASPSPSP
jgi:predicted Zn-dependent protease